MNIYKGKLLVIFNSGFNAPFMGHNSIHIAQILNIFP
jgi:hypothetical protein